MSFFVGSQGSATVSAPTGTSERGDDSFPMLLHASDNQSRVSASSQAWTPSTVLTAMRSTGDAPCNSSTPRSPQGVQGR